MQSIPEAGIRVAALLALILLPPSASAVAAQTAPTQRDFVSGMRTGIGYTGVMPNAILGIGAYHFVAERPFGVFVDVKTTALSGIANNETYCPAGIDVCTNSWVLAERNDQHIEQASEWLAFDAGIVYALTPQFAILAGGGLVRETRFQEYFDDNEDGAQRVTNSGSYFVADDAEPVWSAQGVAGVLLRAGRRIAFRVGYETAISGLGFGAYLRLR
jgi:hypothetical protein